VVIGAHDEQEGNGVEPSDYGRGDHGLEMRLGQRRDGARHRRARRFPCSVTLDTARVNLVYRRADGHIGWIDPPTIENNAH
jgi:hypothetical protein